MWASVVAHCDAAPILEASEHAFDDISLFIKRFVISDGSFSSPSPGNARLDFTRPERVADFVAVISSIADGGLRARRQGGDDLIRSFAIAGLPL